MHPKTKEGISWCLKVKKFVDASEAAAWYEEKVREVVEDSEIVDEIFRYFGADQTLDFFQAIATDYGVF